MKMYMLEKNILVACSYIKFDLIRLDQTHTIKQRTETSINDITSKLPSDNS